MQAACARAASTLQVRPLHRSAAIDADAMAHCASGVLIAQTKSMSAAVAGTSARDTVTQQELDAIMKAGFVRLRKNGGWKASVMHGRRKASLGTFSRVEEVGANRYKGVHSSYGKNVVAWHGAAWRGAALKQTWSRSHHCIAQAVWAYRNALAPAGSGDQLANHSMPCSFCHPSTPEDG